MAKVVDIFRAIVYPFIEHDPDPRYIHLRAASSLGPPIPWDPTEAGNGQDGLQGGYDQIKLPEMYLPPIFGTRRRNS